MFGNGAIAAALMRAVAESGGASALTDRLYLGSRGTVCPSIALPLYPHRDGRSASKPVFRLERPIFRSRMALSKYLAQFPQIGACLSMQVLNQRGALGRRQTCGLHERGRSRHMMHTMCNNAQSE